MNAIGLCLTRLGRYRGSGGVVRRGAGAWSRASRRLLPIAGSALLALGREAEARRGFRGGGRDRPRQSGRADGLAALALGAARRTRRGGWPSGAGARARLSGGDADPRRSRPRGGEGRGGGGAFAALLGDERLSRGRPGRRLGPARRRARRRGRLRRGVRGLARGERGAGGAVSRRLSRAPGTLALVRA